MKRLEFSLMPYQEAFVFDLEHNQQGMTGGFRTGKSVASVHKAIYLSAVHRGKHGALLSPTYGMTKRNLLPIFRQLRDKYKIDIHGLSAKNPTEVEIRWAGKTSVIHLDISAENNDRLNGVTLAWAGLDEADKCLSPEIAETAWMQMGSRLSDPAPDQIGIRFATSTPEGFGFMYQTFCENIKPGTVLYRASMLDNYMLPPSYVEQQLASLPAHLHSPYILGEFTNINKNVVYIEYDRALNNTNVTVQDLKPGECLHVGMDFNSNGMAAVGFVIRENVAHVIYENIGATNTRSLCEQLTKQLGFLKERGVRLVIYPDPACIQEKSSADSTDLAILKRHNFDVKRMSTHPLIQDRVNSVNARFLNMTGARQLLVNLKTCPLLVRCLLQQTYNSAGEPTKKERLVGTTSTQVDGPLDALGYAVYTHWPLRSARSGTIKLLGY